MNTTRPYWWQVNIGLGNGLVPSDNKPLPEPMLTQMLSPYGVTRPQYVNYFMSSFLLHNAINAMSCNFASCDLV